MGRKEREKTVSRVPVGMERVLYLAATDQAFRQELEADPEGAIAARGLTLRPSELAMLRAVPLEQLLRSVGHVDASPENLKRRSFLRAVAASAVTVAAADAIAGCSDEDVSKGIRPDMDMTIKAGIPPDMPAPLGDAGSPDLKPDTKKNDDLAVTPDGFPAGTGIRPDGR